MSFLKKRIINIRITFWCFFGLIAGILFSYGFLCGKFSSYLWLAIGLVMALLIIGFFCYAETTKRHNENIKFRKNISRLTKLSCILFFVAFVLGLVVTIFPLYKIANQKNYYGEVYVSGIVCDYVEDTSTYKKLVLKDCTISKDNVTDKLDYKILVYTSNYADVKLGDKLSFNGQIDKYIQTNSNDFIKLIQGIGYSSYVNLDSIISINGKMELKDIIKSQVKSVLDENLSQDNSNIAYGVLFGEKQGISDDITQMFSYAGISHILAVSGLHIGVLFSLIYVFLKKCKVNPWVRLIILALVFGFYSYLCGFTPSVCRASIMSLLVALCDVYSIDYDAISSLSIAGIIILLFNPLSLFTTSFQLSFLCVFSIISFAPIIEKLFNKIKMPRFISSTFAISISTNIVILHICLNAFDKVSLLGVFTNIFVLPIFSVTYVLFFVIAFICILLKFLGFLLFVPNLFLHLIKIIADFSSSISFGIFKAFNISYIALVILILFCLVTHFLMIRKVGKIIICSLLLCVISVYFATGLLPKNYNGSNVILNYSASDNVVYYVEDNNVTMIGSEIERFSLAKALKKLKINKVDNIVAFDLSLNNLSNLKEIIKDYGIQKVYIKNSNNWEGLKELIPQFEFYSNSINIGKLKLNFFDDKNKSYYFEVENIGKFLNVNNESVIIENDLHLIYKDIDYLIIPYMFNENILDSFNVRKYFCNKTTEVQKDSLLNMKIYDKIILSEV